jgi:hypothetical protein
MYLNSVYTTRGIEDACCPSAFHDLLLRYASPEVIACLMLEERMNRSGQGAFRRMVLSSGASVSMAR